MRNTLAVIPAYVPIHWKLLEALSALSMPYIHVHECSDPVRARSQLLSDAMQTEAEYFLLLSPDILPSPEQISSLLESPILDECNSVTGNFLAQSGKARIALESPVNASASAVRCLSAEPAFTAIARKTIERLDAHVPPLLDERSRHWRPYFLPFILIQEEPKKYQYCDPVGSFWWRLRNLCQVSLWLEPQLLVARAGRTVLHAGLKVESA